MPTVARHAEVHVDIVDNYDPTGPFGAKGLASRLRVNGGGDLHSDSRRGGRPA
jgi:hypothetical protein